MLATIERGGPSRRLSHPQLRRTGNSMVVSSISLLDLKLAHTSRYRLPSTTLVEAEAIMRTRLPSEEEPWMENYAILEKSLPGEETSKPVMIGCIGIPRLAEDLDGVEVGYGLHPDFWGKGYATEALQLFIKHYWNSKSETSLPVIE